MELSERVSHALDVLGGGKVKHPRPLGRPKRKAPRKVASFIMGRSNDISRRARYHQCSRKVRYESPSAAKCVIHEALVKRGTHLKMYLCAICGGYHLTKSGKHYADRVKQ